MFQDRIVVVSAEANWYRQLAAVRCNGIAELRTLLWQIPWFMLITAALVIAPHRYPAYRQAPCRSPDATFRMHAALFARHQFAASTGHGSK